MRPGPQGSARLGQRPHATRDLREGGAVHRTADQPWLSGCSAWIVGKVHDGPSEVNKTAHNNRTHSSSIPLRTVGHIRPAVHHPEPDRPAPNTRPGPHVTWSGLSPAPERPPPPDATLRAPPCTPNRSPASEGPGRASRARAHIGYDASEWRPRVTATPTEPRPRTPTGPIDA